MIRVAMIASYPIDPGIVPGGVTAVAATLVLGLARRGDIELHVVCCQKDVTRDHTEMRDGALIHFLRDPDRLTQVFGWRSQRVAIARTLAEIRPDVVHAQGLGLATAAAIDSGLPFAISLHGILWKEASMTHPSWVKRARGRIRARRAMRQLLATTNVFITSTYASRMLPEGRPYREFVVRNPAADELFAIENRPSVPPRILMVGGLRHRKDPLTAILVFEKVLRAFPGATLRIVGPPSHTPLDLEIEETVRIRGLSKSVSLLGLVPDSVLHEEYARASLLLLTSLEETAPVALGEACAVGLPQVGTNAGGIPDLIRENETGFVRPIGDVKALAERVIAILGDEALRARLARRAKEVGRAEFALDSIAEKTAEAYREILKDAKSEVAG